MSQKMIPKFKMNPLEFKIRGNLNGIKYPCLVDVKYDGITVIAKKIKNVVTQISTDGINFRPTTWGATVQNEGIYISELVDKMGKTENDGKLGSLYKVLKVKDKEDFHTTTRIIRFDILENNGKDVSDLPLIERKSLLVDDRHDCQSIIAENKEEVMAFYEQAIKAGFEGVVVKNLHETFAQQTWVKIKMEDELELTVTKVEATRFEVNHGGKIVGVRRISQIAVGDVVRIRHNGITKSGSLRNPRQVVR